MRKPLDILRSSMLVALAAIALAAPVRANELSAAARPTTFVIHDAAETLRDYCTREADGTLWFQLPGGARWELVTSTEDAAIANHGDGSFHPFDKAEVERALRGVRFPLQHVAAEVFLLPYPRRNGLESAAGPGIMLMAPGVRPVSVQQQHAEFTHELGHVVQYALMPDQDDAHWNQYRALRGISDAGRFSARGEHRVRPHEIFAEDFRALYGDADANYSGTIENDELSYPTRVAGLDAFVSGLADAPYLGHGALTLLGDGMRGAVALARAHGGAASLDVFDAAGRRLVTLQAQAIGAGAQWTWDGRDAQGRMVSHAVVFARAQDGVGGSLRIVRL